MPQDCRTTPDGKHFLIANMEADGVHVVDAEPFKQVKFIKTGKGAHGIYFSRDAKYAYVSNRGEGYHFSDQYRDSLSRQEMDDPGRRQSRHGRCLSRWQERFGSRAAIIARFMPLIPQRENCGHASKSAMGRMAFAFYPQPGRYSLGHTGNMR